MGRKKLTDAQVIRLRTAASKGVIYTKLAEQYGLHETQISKIARGGSYASIGGPITQRHPGKKKKLRVTRGKKKATAAASNDRLQVSDLASLSIDDAARFLQALAMEWPNIKESFQLLDRLITGNHDEE